MTTIKAYGNFGSVILIDTPITDLLRANILVGNYLAMNIVPHIPTPTGVHAT